jgi:hypothetical protein
MAKPRPAPLRERDITRQIAREYYKEFDQLIESDVIIVGAGPSGLICAHDLAAISHAPHRTKPGARGRILVRRISYEQSHHLRAGE